MDYMVLTGKKLKKANKMPLLKLDKLYKRGGLAHIIKAGEVVGYKYEEDHYYD